MSTVLAFRNVSKSYVAGHGGCRAAVRVLQGVTFDVQAGELVQVVGPRGAGKTALLLCAAGLLVPDGGTVAWPAVPLAGGAAARAGYAAYAAAPLAPHSFGSVAARLLELANSRTRLLLIDSADDAAGADDSPSAWIAALRAHGAAVLVASRAPRFGGTSRVIVLSGGRIARDVCPGSGWASARVAEPGAATALD